MAENYSGPIQTNDPGFLHTASLYAVKSELAIRGVHPQIKMLRDQECIQIGELTIFVGYSIMSDKKACKITHYLPVGEYHAYIIWIRYGALQGFLIIPPDAIQKFYKEGHISKDGNEYKIEITYLETKDVFLNDKISINILLEKRQVLLKPYVNPYTKKETKKATHLNIIFNIQKGK